MSEMSRQARRAMRAKAHRLATSQSGKVDASDYGPEEVLGADVKTGMRPVSRRAYKNGGKVEGEAPHQNAGRKPRKTGGKALVDDFQNRDAKDANTEREGAKHVGGLKRGGRAEGGEVDDDGDFDLSAARKGAQKPKPKPRPVVMPSDPYEPTPPKGSGSFGGQAYRKGGRIKKADGGDIALGLLSPAGLGLKSLIDGKKRGGSVSDGELQGTRPTGGRLARKSGGENWIKDAIKQPGALRRELHVPEGKTISTKKLKAAEHSKNPTEAKRARLAETLKRVGRKDGGRAKGKTDINIIIGRPAAQPAPGMPPMIGGAPGAAPVPVPVGPAALGAVGPQIPGGAPAGPAAGPPMPMPRKRGGRASYKDMDAGSGSGVGRLEKTEIEKNKR